MKKQNQIVEYYKSKDNQIVSLLYATGQVLDSSYWENGSCYFLFENKPQCEAVIADYYKGKIVLNAKAIFEAISTIKGIILSR